MTSDDCKCEATEEQGRAMALNGRAKQWLCMQGVVSTSEGNERNRNELRSNGVAGKGAEEHSNGIAWG